MFYAKYTRKRLPTFVPKDELSFFQDMFFLYPYEGIYQSMDWFFLH